MDRGPKKNGLPFATARFQCRGSLFILSEQEEPRFGIGIGIRKFCAGGVFAVGFPTAFHRPAHFVEVVEQKNGVFINDGLGASGHCKEIILRPLLVAGVDEYPPGLGHELQAHVRVLQGRKIKTSGYKGLACSAGGQQAEEQSKAK